MIKRRTSVSAVQEARNARHAAPVAVQVAPWDLEPESRKYDDPDGDLIDVTQEHPDTRA